MEVFQSVTITSVAVTCTATGSVLDFQAITGFTNVSPQFLTYYIYNSTASVTKYGSAGNTRNHHFTVYGLPNGTYSIDVTDQEDNTVTKTGVVVNCAPQCNIAALTGTVVGASSVSATNGSLTLNNPSANQVEYQSDRYVGVWQNSPVFNYLTGGTYTITCREIQNQSCTTVQTFTVPVTLVTGQFVVQIGNVVSVTNTALNNGSFAAGADNVNPGCRYHVVVLRVDTGTTTLIFDGLTSPNAPNTSPVTVPNLTDTQYNVLVTETAPDGGSVTKNQLVTIPRAVLGCTNPRATNYSPVANIDDGTCNLSSGNSGYQGYRDLEEYYLDDNSATGVLKPNVTYDPDYVAPIQNLGSCPI